MEDGVCTKGFPKDFNDATVLLDGMYPRYKRRDTGRNVNKGTARLDNRFVVPYNPALSRKYGCHLNIEVVTSIKAVKYLYKYTYKGHDRVAMDITPIATD